jgi:uridine kinase
MHASAYEYSRRVEIPVYSFEQHQRLKETNPLYSPSVLILEGILALNDPRILEMLDMKVASPNPNGPSHMLTPIDICGSRCRCLPKQKK